MFTLLWHCIPLPTCLAEALEAERGPADEVTIRSKLAWKTESPTLTPAG